MQIVEETIKKLEQITNVSWNFNFSEQEIIINHIIETSNTKHNIYNDKRYNPDASITILELAFSIAMQKGADSISIENVAVAIRKSDFLYESVRKTYANKLLSQYNAIDSKQFTKCKIIKFPNL